VKRILVLFPSEWDKRELDAPRHAGRCSFLFEGPDGGPFRGPALLGFDVRRFVDRVVRRHSRSGIDGAFSTEDMLGVAATAVIARRLGLPGPEPEGVVRAQHKFYARRLQERVLPEATPRFTLISPRGPNGQARGLTYPCFVKPVKATFSVLARRVGGAKELLEHLRFGPIERLVLRRLLQPFNDLLTLYGDGECDARHFLAEDLLEGTQVTLDGFVSDGRVEIFGIVDSVMVPGTHTFRRFEYPSRLPGEVRGRMEEVAGRLVAGSGYDHGCFNVEMVHDPRTDEVRIIEMNLRLSPQFADLYEKVDGCNPYDVQIDLCTGGRPSWNRTRGRFPHAASFALRTFSGSRIVAAPEPGTVRDVERENPGSRILVFGKPGRTMKWEMRALGSYRYAVMNLGGESKEALLESSRAASERLLFRFR